MLHKLGICALLALLAFAPTTALGAQPASAKSAKSAPEATVPQKASELRVRLANGLSVYIIKDTRFPLVCTRLYVRTGSTHEDAKDFGISHVLEHMVFKGTKAYPGTGATKLAESLGGYINAYTSFDKTCYLTDLPSSQWKAGIDIVRELALCPTLDPKELEQEKPVIISELEGNEDKPNRYLFQLIHQASLTGTPYEHPIIGTRETVKAVTRNSLLSYIARWYQPQNMTLLVAGNVDIAKVKEYVTATFSNLGAKGELALQGPIDLERIKGSPKVQVVRKNLKKLYVSLSFAVPGLQDADSVALDGLASLLADDATSYFEKKYHLDLHLVDSINVSNLSFERAGLLAVTATLDADKAEPFFLALLKDLADLKSLPFDEKALDRAKIGMEDSIDRSSETLNGLASWKASVEVDLGGPQGEKNLRSAIKSLTLKDVRDAAARWVTPERLRVRMLSPEGVKLPDMEGLINATWPQAKKESTAKAPSKASAEERVNLGGGHTLIMLPDRTIPYFSASMLMPGGNALLDSKDQGLGTLTARMLSCGSGTLDREAFERSLAENNATVSASSKLQTFGFGLSAPTRSAKEAFNLFKTMIEQPTFSEKELGRESLDMQAELAARADNPMAYLFAKVKPALYGSDHPYGMDNLGTKENLKRFTKADVEGFYKKQRQMPWTLSVCGDFDRNAVVDWAKSLANTPPSEATLKVEAPKTATGKKVDLSLPSKLKAHLLLVFPTVPNTHPDAPALMLLDSVLSGQSGLLFTQMRDKESLGYTVTAFNSFKPTCGEIMFYIGTTPQQIEKALAGFKRIIGDLKAKPLPKEMLAAGSSRLEGEYSRSLQSLGSRAGEASLNAVLGTPADWQKQLIDKTFALTPEDIQNVAKKYLNNPDVFALKP